MTLNIKAWNFQNKIGLGKSKKVYVFDGINFNDAIKNLEFTLNTIFIPEEWEVSGMISADCIFEVESVYDVLPFGSTERNTLFDALEILKRARIKQRELEKFM